MLRSRMWMHCIRRMIREWDVEMALGVHIEVI
jgi:hypothetical protein